MPKFIDTTGKTFGRWTALHREGYSKYGQITWLCLCACGTYKLVGGHELRRGATKSCGCLNNEIRGSWSETHRLTGSREYKLWVAAKCRSKKYRWKFNIEPTDIKIPKKCPVLGIPLYHGKGKLCDNSPTLDRFVAKKGYVKGNVFVISYKANRIKCDATKIEIKKVLRYVSEGL